MEGEGPPFGGVSNAAKPLPADFALQNRRSPSKPPSSPRTSLHGNRRGGMKRFPVFLGRRLPCREVFGRLGGARAIKSTASRLIGEWGALHDNAIHECRDSACRRPFGVRLRGNGWFHRSSLHGDAAPLRMTQRVWCFVRYNLFVAMLL